MHFPGVALLHFQRVIQPRKEREREPRMSARGDHGRKFLLLYPRRGVFPASKLTYLRLGCNSWEHNTPLLRRLLLLLLLASPPRALPVAR